MTDIEGASSDLKLLVIMPVFNDWSACRELLMELERTLVAEDLSVRVLVVDDGSTVDVDDELTLNLVRIREIKVLRLRRNVGHQWAIGIGLAYAEAQLACDAVIVMDADGQDDPRDIPKLLTRFEEEGRRKVVFAARIKRSEAFLFQVLYRLYQTVHLLLTGRGVNVGNFSVIPASVLHSLVTIPELWSHYAAAVMAKRVPSCTVPTTRLKRLDGQSTMNYVGLVAHGLTAVSVYSEIVAVRLLIASSFSAILLSVAVLAVVLARLVVTIAIPGWAVYATGSLLMFVLQAILAAVIFSFLILSNRHRATFLPARDYPFFVQSAQPHESVSDSAVTV